MENKKIDLSELLKLKVKDAESTIQEKAMEMAKEMVSASEKALKANSQSDTLKLQKELSELKTENAKIKSENEDRNFDKFFEQNKGKKEFKDAVKALHKTKSEETSIEDFEKELMDKYPNFFNEPNNAITHPRANPQKKDEDIDFSDVSESTYIEKENISEGEK